MPYVTSFERLAREEGRQEGREQGLAEGLQAGVLALLAAKFKKVGAKDARKIRSMRDAERLQELLQAAADAKTLDEALSLLRKGED